MFTRYIRSDLEVSRYDLSVGWLFGIGSSVSPLQVIVLIALNLLC